MTKQDLPTALTPCERRMLDAILYALRSDGTPPTPMELTAVLKQSTAQTYRTLHRLKDLGWINGIRPMVASQRLVARAMRADVLATYSSAIPPKRAGKTSAQAGESRRNGPADGGVQRCDSGEQRADGEG